MNLLTRSNKKILKSQRDNWYPLIMHLWPWRLPSTLYNTCPRATPGCISSCLNISGLGKTYLVQNSRKRKTLMFYEEREKFVTQLVKDIDSARRAASKRGQKVCIRLNGTSDIAWEVVLPGLFTEFSDVTFFDYTKTALRAHRFATGNFPKNYKLIFSLSERPDSLDDARDLLKLGCSIAVVFRKSPPDMYLGKPVVNGDLHDLFFLHPPSSIVGLKAKNRAKQDRTGFTVDTADVALSKLDNDILDYYVKHGQFKTTLSEISDALKVEKSEISKRIVGLREEGYL